MTDDPYPRPSPVVNAITGFVLSTLTLSLPLYAVTSERVKSPYKGFQPQTNGRQETSFKRTLPTVDACGDLRISSRAIRSRNV